MFLLSSAIRDRAQELSGWDARISIREGMARLIADFRA